MSAMSISRAIKRAGSQVRLAAILRVSKQSVNEWVKTGRLPPRRLYELKQRRRSWFANGKSR